MEILKTVYEFYQSIGLLNALLILYLFAIFNLVMFNIFAGAIQLAFACFGSVCYLVGTSLSSLLVLFVMVTMTIGFTINNIVRSGR